ncbi:hypothetical protein H4R99_001017 [Coemansia sp. RSA 1722]|nr:hypothetical protein IWW45_008359 [Coemansia sp. RSA 485]KAJ2601611.1 hypothetical protein GGF39_001175 [Coemansia sp. RSA 1721]KAJ2605604.1 hypothetical protein H4R99_001017 [Coemansia sp. RSA 1722]KAJ2639007.1 hypothetical protein GGF40_001190 [Coemansia sp. RSA 1286]
MPQLDEDGKLIKGTVAYNIRVGVLMSIYVLYVFYVVGTFIMFLVKARDKHSGLAQRNVRMISFLVVSCFLMGTVGMISTAFWEWPAFLRLWLTNVSYIVMYSTVAVRGFKHIVVSNLHNITNKLASGNNPGFKNMMPTTNDMGFLKQSSRNRNGSQSSIFSNTDFDNNDMGGSDEKKIVRDLDKQVRQASMRLESGPEMKMYKQLQKYTRLQRYTTDRAIMLFVVGHLILALIISLIVNILNPQFSISPMSMECRMIWGFLPLVAVVAIYCVFIMPVVAVKCWKLKDAYGIRNDLFACTLMGWFCLIMNTVWDNVLGRIAFIWSGWFFTWITGVAIHTVAVTIPLLSAIRHSRNVIDRMHGASTLGTSMAAVIAGAGGHDLSKRSEYNAILADPYEYRFFCDFAASCFCSEMTAFIDEYQALKSLTVISLGSEDIWREDVDQLEPNYMSRMATNGADAGIGYLALANRNANPNSKSLRLQTPPTVSILETAKAVYPQYNLNEQTPFPVAAMDKLVAIFSVFVNSSSYTAVSLPSGMVLRIREKLGKSELSLTILDEIKEEVLNMLYFDVFTRYSKSK